MIRIADLAGCARYGSRQPPSVAFEEGLPPLFYLRTGRSARGVPLESILLLRADGDQSVACLSDGGVLTDIRPLKWWASVLPPSHYMRVHRSAIAQIRRVVGLTRRAGGGWQARVEGVSEPVSVSRTMAPKLRSRLGL